MHRRARIGSFDGLRGMAALAVMMFHFDIFFVPQARLHDIIPGLSRAYLGVDLFLLLSGFIMAHVYGYRMAASWRNHWLDFVIARFARIYPVFALTTLIMVIIVAASGMPLRFVSFSLHSLSLQPILMQIWWPGLSWNYPAWSLSTEAASYFLFIFSAGLFLKGQYPRLMATCCAVVLAAVSIAHHGHLNLFSGISALLRAVSEFILGVLIFRAHSENKVPSRGWPVAILPAALVCIGVLWHQDFIVVYALACLMLYCANTTDALGRALDSRPAITLGNWSYSIYLWHVPTHYAVMVVLAAIGHPVNKLDLSTARLLSLMAILVVLGVSALSYRYLEVPARRLMLSWRRSPGELDQEPGPSAGIIG
jgi:peptidoglycan/LPS O-acetylase OafA/YrhL